jgi:regulator of protease activity HflC (stomatin/prohibitin superfamily)
MWFWLGAIFVIAAVLILPAIYIVPQWEKVAVVRFGKIEKIVDPGIHLRIPVIDTLMHVDIRTQTVDLMVQQAITKDNIMICWKVEKKLHLN